MEGECPIIFSSPMLQSVVNLKLEAELFYAQSNAISLANVVQVLLFADAMNCALLKEIAMDFIVDNTAEVLRKVSLEDVPGGLYAELLAAFARKESGKGRGNLSTMRISDLRRRLHEKGLDFDGSRETLMATLKQNQGSCPESPGQRSVSSSSSSNSSSSSEETSSSQDS
ncbi:hypothetical protein ACHAWF_018878 [Thalassiosira exigua]